MEIKDFLNFTFSVIKDNKVHVTSAVFTFGREDLIPNMFIEIVRKIKLENKSVESLIYYLEGILRWMVIITAQWR